MPNYELERDSCQFNFHQSRAQIQVMGGGYGNGKTTALAVKALKICRDYPGSEGLLARSTYPKLNDTLRKVFMSWCPPHWIKRRPTQDDNTCYLTNGTVINFRYIAQRGKNSPDGSSTSNLLSATYDWIGVDQVEDPEITEKDILDLFGRLRGSTPYRPNKGEDDISMPSIGPQWVMLTLNPTRNWAYKKLIRPYHVWKEHGIVLPDLIVGKDKQPIIEVYESSTYANAKHLGERYLTLLEGTYKGQMRERYLMGKWAAFEGLVHPSFERGKHMITRDQALAHLFDCRKRHVKLAVLEMYDFGLVSPSVYILAFIDDFGRIICIDGYYEPECGYELQPAKIRSVRDRYTGQLRVTDDVVADPAIFRKQVIKGRSRGESIANLYREMNIFMKPGHNEIISGIAKVNAYLSGRVDIPHLITGEMGSPLIYFVDDMNWIEDEITSYFWKKNPQGISLDEPQDVNDHAMNAIKYGLSFRPMPSEIVLPKDQVIPAYMFWHEEREVRRV